MQFKTFRLLLLLFLCISCSDEDSNPEQPMQAENEINISALPVSSGFNNDIIIIEGENFNEFANEIVIKFSSTQAEILEILASQITVKVPLSLSVGIHTILLEYNEEILTVGEFTILQETELLTASSNGKIYSVGASTGSYDLIGEVDYEFLSFLLAINIIYDGENVYFFDTYGDEINQIIKYNLENESTIVQQLSFPDAVEGS
ncbi:MAG: IPT/TIG domain-containing protein, partial [Bacteroidota bacterium]